MITCRICDHDYLDTRTHCPVCGTLKTRIDGSWRIYPTLRPIYRGDGFIVRIAGVRVDSLK